MTDAVVANASLTGRARLRAIVASSAGNLVEWYDFYVYSFTALYFAASFFPGSDPTAQLLNAAAVFAVGFLMRPLGGWLFGRIADRRGRRTALLLSVLLMCVGSLAIAVMPTHATIGAAAPILLLLVRMVQGLSLGGEYGATATYMSEVSVSHRRGYYASFQYVTLIGGQLVALCVWWCCSSCCPRPPSANGPGACRSPLAQCSPSSCSICDEHCTKPHRPRRAARTPERCARWPNIRARC
jgi:MFS family permease